MDAIVTAGGIPTPQEPLFEITKGQPKALIPIVGKPMVQWVLDALSDSKRIERIVVVGLSPKSGLKCRKPVVYVPNQGKILDNLQAGVTALHQINPQAEHFLFVSGDIPTITGEMVDWVIDACMQTNDDIYYNVIQRETVEKTFPDARRTWTKLKDMVVCGGDMNMARASLVSERNEFWDRIFEARKSPFKQAAMIGFGTIFLLLMRQLTLQGAAERVLRRLKITGRAIVCPYAEVGMDVDKPHHLEAVTRYLKRKTAGEKKTPARKIVKKATPAPKGKPAVKKVKRAK